VEQWNVLGCLLSHREVLRRVQAEGLDHALVLEDDCVLLKDSEVVQRTFAQEAAFITRESPDWQIIYLGGVLGFTPAGSGGQNALKITGTERLIRARHTYQAHAYIVRRTVIDQICARLDQGFAADAALVSVMRQEDDARPTKYFRFIPSLLQQGISKNRKHGERDSDVLSVPARRKSKAERAKQFALEMSPASPSHRKLKISQPASAAAVCQVCKFDYDLVERESKRSRSVIWPNLKCEKKWECFECTFINFSTSPSCVMCGCAAF
jgi:hypothetical protein